MGDAFVGLTPVQRASRRRNADERGSMGAEVVSARP